MNENMALTESTYYILLALAQPRHGYGIMQQTEQAVRGTGAVWRRGPCTGR